MKIFSNTDKNKTFKKLANDFFNKNQKEIDAQKEKKNSLLEEKRKIVEELKKILKKDYHHQQLKEVKELSDSFFKIKSNRSKKNNLLYKEFKEYLDDFYLKKNKEESNFFSKIKKILNKKKLSFLELKNY